MESNSDAAQMKIDEDSWVVQIKESLDVLQEEDGENVREFCVSVYNVPKELLAQKPEAYIPQMVSIGPCHHWNAELQHMDRYKMATAYRFEKRMNGRPKFRSVVVEEFKKYDWKIRSCYHKFIDYKEETLAWIMALDAVFLLECLQFYVRHADQISHLEVEPLGLKSGTIALYNSIFKDLMKLENQLPLFLVTKLLELKLGCRAKAEERLSSLLCLVFQEVSPFSFKLPDSSNLRIKERRHMLEALYYCIVPLSNNQIAIRFEEEKGTPYPAGMSTVTPILIEEEIVSPDSAYNSTFTDDSPDSPDNSTFTDDSADSTDNSTVTEAFSSLWDTLSSIKVGPVRILTEFLRRLLSWRPAQFVTKLPLNVFLSSFKRLNKYAMGNGEESSVNIIPPSRHELNIPSVADLYFAGVKFSATDGDLTTIKFDEKNATLYLPKVKLDINTEVILRNLLAFEASAASGALVFKRYIDFMNAMIDGVKDVKLLRESGIIRNHLTSDAELASLWNSMGKCVRVTEAGYLDNVIKDLNRYYSRKWKVRMAEFLNNYIFSSWKFLSLVAAAILLIITCLQAYCSVYDCKTWMSQ